MTDNQKKPILFWWVVGVVVVALMLWGGYAFICWLWSLNGEASKFEKASKITLGFVGLIGIGLATWRNYALQRQAHAAQNQAEIARGTQISDQLTKAMDLLARTDSKGKLLKEARIGGLYSLESSAHADPEGYGAQVMKTIVAYIRENAQKTAEKPVPEKVDNADVYEPLARPLGEDVRVAFAVLKRLYDRHADTPEKRKKIKLARFFDDGKYDLRLKDGIMYPVRDDLDFSRADFFKLDLSGVEWVDRPCCDRTNFQNAELVDVNFAGAHLEQAFLQDVGTFEIDMRGAILCGAQLQKAFLSKARLQGAILRGAQLQRSLLHEAQLQEADLSDARLPGAHLEGAQLQGAKLWNTDLRGASLEGANLQGAYLVSDTLKISASLQGANLERAQLQGAYLQWTELQVTDLTKVKYHTTSEDLEKMLTDAEVSEERRNGILGVFESQGGSKGLWQPKLAQIFCDKDFAPLAYGHKSTQRLDPNDENIDWHEKWEAILGNIQSLSNVRLSDLPYAIDGFIFIHGRMGREATPCAKGLRVAINKLIEKHPAIEEQLPGQHLRDWLKKK